MHVRQTEIAALEFVSQTFVVDAGPVQLRAVTSAGWQLFQAGEVEDVVVLAADELDQIIARLTGCQLAGRLGQRVAFFARGQRLATFPRVVGGLPKPCW